MCSWSISLGIICFNLIVTGFSFGNADLATTWEIETIGYDGWKLSVDPITNAVTVDANGKGINCDNSTGDNTLFSIHGDMTASSYNFSAVSGNPYQCCMLSKPTNRESSNNKTASVQCFLVSQGKEAFHRNKNDFKTQGSGQSTTSVVLITIAIYTASMLAVLLCLAILLRNKVTICIRNGSITKQKYKKFEVAGVATSNNNAPIPPPRVFLFRSNTDNRASYIIPESPPDSAEIPAYMEILPFSESLRPTTSSLSQMVNGVADQATYEVVR